MQGLRHGRDNAKRAKRAQGHRFAVLDSQHSALPWPRQRHCGLAGKQLFDCSDRGMFPSVHLHLLALLVSLDASMALLHSCLSGTLPQLPTPPPNAHASASTDQLSLLQIIQFFLFPGLIGFIWSVWWGVLIYRKSQFHEAVLLGISIYSNQ